MNSLSENQIKLAVDEGNLSVKIPYIMCVDDQPDNLDILEIHLKKSGCKCITFLSGDLALEHINDASNTLPDVILLDIMMPGTDGIEVLKILKADARTAHIPVILQTSMKGEEKTVEGIEAGAYYYLNKPYQHAVIKSVVKSAIQQSKKSEEIRDELFNINSIIKNIRSSSFEIQNFSEARSLANYLARFTDEPSKYVVSLTALMINAIEHGNLAIGFEEKNRLISEQRYDEEIEARLNTDQNKNKVVRVDLRREHDDSFSITIEDEGIGFDWIEYIDFDPTRVTDPNGRGIAMAFIMNPGNIQYYGNGNKVVYKISKNTANSE